MPGMQDLADHNALVAQPTQIELEAIGTLVRTNLTHGGFLVAEFYGSDGTPHSEEAKANAALFVAANDLLEALTELEREADSSLDMRPEFRRAIANAHAAIAKATAGAQ